MASLFKQPRSPFWWIKHRISTGKIVRRSTGFRHGIGADTRKAQQLRAEKSLIETQYNYTGENWLWVPDFFEQRYFGKEKTKNRYLVAWKSLSIWLDREEIGAPRALTYNHALTYLKWRQKPDAPELYRCSHNTALGELKLLGLIVKEAIRRGFAITNPCHGLGIRKEKPAEKPMITDLEVVKIAKALRRKPSWMRIAFEIAIHQGCRLRETCLPLTDIDLDRMTITFNAKGGNRFTTALHPGLVPMFQKMKGAGRKMTCDMPPMPSKAWWLFFKKLKMKHLCFHCTRVTVVTRLAKAGVPMAQAMRFVGHASETIHRVYQRLGTEDLSACVSALSFSAPSKPLSFSDKRSSTENQGAVASI